MAGKSRSRSGRLIASADADEADAFEQAHALLADAAEAEYPAALALFRVAAAQGHAQAQNDLATMLRDGLGCAPDIGEAIRWYRLSAAQGEPSAQYNLGLIYRHGLGVRADKGLAAEYLLQAADAGDAAAMCELGDMLQLGEGVDRDIVVAAWLHLAAAEDGDVGAIDSLGSYFGELVRPALDGNVHAARALHRVYRDGFGHDADPSLAWAWIRWAHDACLPGTGGPEDEEAATVQEDYELAVDSIAPAIRQRGDAALAAIIAEHGSPLLAAAGGSVQLFA